MLQIPSAGAERDYCYPSSAPCAPPRCEPSNGPGLPPIHHTFIPECNCACK